MNTGKRSGNERGRLLYEVTTDNAGLVRAVRNAARDAVRLVRWREAPDLDRLPELLHRYVNERTRYRPEKSTQVIRYPSAFVRQAVGDCKSTAVFIAAMGAAAGCRATVVFIRQGGRPYFSHVFATLDGVTVDPLLPLGTEAPNTGRVEYEVT